MELMALAACKISKNICPNRLYGGLRISNLRQLPGRELARRLGIARHTIWPRLFIILLDYAKSLARPGLFNLVLLRVGN